MMLAYAGGRRRWGSSPGGGGCNGLEGRAGVDGEAGQAGVAALGHEEREGHSGFGEVGEAGVPDWAADTLTRVEAPRRRVRLLPGPLLRKLVSAAR